MNPTLEERTTLALIRALSLPEFEVCPACRVMVIYGLTDDGYLRHCGCTLKPTTEEERARYGVTQ